MNNTKTILRQGEQWFYLRSKTTSELTSPKTMSAFLPELNCIADDFMHLLKTNRDSNHHIEDFFELSMRFALEGGFHYNLS
jgi:hypothetical protein